MLQVLCTSMFRVKFAHSTQVDDRLTSLEGKVG